MTHLYKKYACKMLMKLTPGACPELCRCPAQQNRKQFSGKTKQIEE